MRERRSPEAPIHDGYTFVRYDDNGEFITDDRHDSGQQIFAASEEGTVRRECWISLSYGLLTESILKSGGETIYDAIQTGLEILAAGDETFEDVFTLPDGTVPFQE